MPEQGGAQVALFIDWDNIAISTAADHGGAIPDLRRIVQVTQSYGTLVIARAYAEWGVTSDRLAVYRAGVEPVYAPTFRFEADISFGDGSEQIRRLIDGVQRLVDEHESLETPPDVALPSSEGLELQQAMRPRDAFFGRTESVKAEDAVGRIAAGMASPYPPGVPVYAPGELISREVVDYLRTSLEAGALIPDVADPKLDTIKVVADD